MTNYHTDLTQTFHALADPTRRKVVERLTQGPASVSELAEPFNMALPSFMQHLNVLERSNLVRSEKVGRVRTFQIRPKQMKQARQWFHDQLELWQTRLDQLDDYALTLAQKEKNNE